MKEDPSVTKIEHQVESPLNPIDVNMIKEEINSNVFECKLCSAVFSIKTNLKQHLKKYHPDRVKCNVCNVEMSKKYYRKHLKKFHGFNVDRLENDNENDEERRISENCQQALDEGINPCEVLFKVEVQEGTVEQLRKKMLDNPSGVECKFCHQFYSNTVNLKKHIYNVHQMKKVQCVLCEKVVNKKSMDRHMCIVHGTSQQKKERKLTPEEHKIQCNLCDKKCSNLLNLQNHVKNIHEAEQLKCEKCEFTGIRKHLDRHMKKEHNEEIYQCSRCQKILKSKSTLKEHMWIHTDHRRFICDICGMRFKRTSNYHGHLKSHQEKKFHCHLCGNFFLRKRYLVVHQQTIHNFYGEGVPPQEKGFQCEICGVKLKWKNNLMAHMRIHTGEKPYKCKVCGDEFTCHGSLRTHLSKHSICPTTPDVSTMFLQHAYLPPSVGLPNT